MCRGVEVVETLLPATIAFYADLDTSEDDLLTTFEVDAELHHVSIIDRVRAALHPGAGQAHMVEEGAGAGLDILDVPLSIGAPELAMSPADDLGLEAHDVAGLAVAFAEAPHPDLGVGLFELARKRGKV